MKNKKLFIFIIVNLIIAISCFGKYNEDSLKKDASLLEEVISKCKVGIMKKNDGNCILARKIQQDLAKEGWEKNKKIIIDKLIESGKNLEERKYETMFDLWSPELLYNAAENAGVGVEEFKKGIIDYMNGNAPKKAKVTRDFNSAKPGRTTKGRTYVRIPVVFDNEVDGQHIITRRETLAFEDKGKWYAINLDRVSLPVIKQTYPD